MPQFVRVLWFILHNMTLLWNSYYYLYFKIKNFPQIHVIKKWQSNILMFAYLTQQAKFAPTTYESFYCQCYWHISFSSVAQSCLTLCDPMDCSKPGLPVHHQLPELTQTHVHWISDASNRLILCCPHLLPPSIFPSIWVFSNESALCMRWPKYWSFSFSISPSNEHPGLISFRMDWLDLLAVQGTLKSLLQHHSSKASILQPQLSL